jgi:TolA-binding protein
MERAYEIQQQIDELDSRAERLEMQRTQQSNSLVQQINQRNRDLMKKTFLNEGGVISQEDLTDAVDDPFTRKYGRTRVVAGSTRKNITPAGDEIKNHLKILNTFRKYHDRAKCCWCRSRNLKKSSSYKEVRHSFAQNQ